jgi:hypothetical protein
MVILEIALGVLHVLLVTTSDTHLSSSAFDLAQTVSTNHRPQYANFAVQPVRHAISPRLIALLAISIAQRIGISMKTSALRAALLSLLISVLSAKNVMLSAVRAKIAPHSVFHVTHRPNLSSTSGLTVWKSVLKGPTPIIKD